jgi:hypothetical protein
VGRESMNRQGAVSEVRVAQSQGLETGKIVGQKNWK